jgi:hypothetical protein
MRILKALASFVAFALAVVGAGMALHLLAIPPGDGDLLLSFSGFLGIVGISPIKLTLQQAKICTGLSSILVAMGVAHAGTAHLAVIQPWLMNALGILGTLLGIAGASPTLANTQPAAAEAAVEAAAAKT